MYKISTSGITLSCILLLISLILWTSSMESLIQHQAFAQTSTNLANLLSGGAIQAFKHKDVNGTLQDLRLIGIPNNPSSCTASTVPIQTLSRGVPNPQNPNSGVVSMSVIQTYTKMVQSPTNPSSCTASTLAIQRLSKGPDPNPSNPNSGVVPTFAASTVSKMLPNSNPSNPNSGVVPTFAAQTIHH
jgi:hypothetical protein